MLSIIKISVGEMVWKNFLWIVMMIWRNCWLGWASIGQFFLQKVWNLNFCASVQTHVRAFDVSTPRTHVNYELQTGSTYWWKIVVPLVVVMVLPFGHTSLLLHTNKSNKCMLVMIKVVDPLWQSKTSGLPTGINQEPRLQKNAICVVWNDEAMRTLKTHAGRWLEHKQIL